MRDRQRSSPWSSSSKITKLAKKMILIAANACGSFSRKKALVDPIVVSDHSISNSASISGSCAVSPKKARNVYGDGEGEEGDEIVVAEQFGSSTITTASLPSSKNMCAICLDPLNYNISNNKSRNRNSKAGGEAIFTAQCSHAFHFACIASNVRHGSVTCPICRAHWTQLPRSLNPAPLPTPASDPILRILDDSIATFRVHRRSFLRSARYDDDDPVDPDAIHPHHPRLHLSLTPLQTPLPSSSNYSCVTHKSSSNTAYLSVKLANPRAMDLVLVASPNGPHLRLLKQCMALVVFSLRPVDRLAIVTYSSAAARVFPLRRMTSYGKRTALQVIDRLFYMGQADPVEGLKKGAKILQDRSHKNPESTILHLSDNPTAATDSEVTVPVHRFHVGFGFGTSNNGFVMNEFGEFLAGLLGGGTVRDVQLRVRTGGEDFPNGRVVRIGELRGGEERRVLLELGEGGHAFVQYCYCKEEDFDDDEDDKDNENEDDDERFVRGESLLSVGDGKSNGDVAESGVAGISCTRVSSVESWDYHDPYMARRWAKHLHGYRL